MRIQSKSALTAGDIQISNGDLVSVDPVSGTDSYDVLVSTKSSKAAVAVSTIASAAVAASTITVDVNTDTPQVIHLCHIQLTPAFLEVHAMTGVDLHALHEVSVHKHNFVAVAIPPCQLQADIAVQ